MTGTMPILDNTTTQESSDTHIVDRITALSKKDALDSIEIAALQQYLRTINEDVTAILENEKNIMSEKFPAVQISADPKIKKAVYQINHYKIDEHIIFLTDTTSYLSSKDGINYTIKENQDPMREDTLYAAEKLGHQTGAPFTTQQLLREIEGKNKEAKAYEGDDLYKLLAKLRGRSAVTINYIEDLQARITQSIATSSDNQTFTLHAHRMMQNIIENYNEIKTYNQKVDMLTL